MNDRYKKMADVFYSDNPDKYKKALGAATLLDNRLENTYAERSAMSDIHFDQSAFTAYFDYDKLIILPNYEAKSKKWLIILNG